MKFKINPFKRLFYLFVKSIVMITFSIFYRKEKTHNEQYFKTPGPCIIIGNHPNTMVDVLNVAKKKNAIVHFLANAGMFSTAITNWFFTTFFCIKVERPKDVPGKRIDNAASLKYSADFLGRYGTLFIAAEGTSKLERRLRDLKTGGARIAFDAMQKNNWELPITFLPVGITYENPKLARYDLFYNFGKPIQVIDYKERFEKEPAKTIKLLTSDIQSSMQDLLLHTDPVDDDLDKLVQKLERIHKNEHGNDHANQFFISKAWITKLLDLKYKDTAAYQTIKDQVNTYCEHVSQHKLTDKSVQDRGGQLITILYFILGGVFALWGWLNNLAAFYLPDYLIRRLKLYPGYTATVKLLLVISIFPPIYWLQYKLVSTFGIFPRSYIIYVLQSSVFGFFSLWYSRKWTQYKADRRWNKLKKQNNELYKSIQTQRKEITDTVFSQISTKSP